MNDELLSKRANGVVRAFMALRQETVETLAPSVGMDASTLYRRLAKTRPSGWKAGELYRIAEHFGISVADLYEGKVTATSSWWMGDVLDAPPLIPHQETALSRRAG